MLKAQVTDLGLLFKLALTTIGLAAIDFAMTDLKRCR